MPWSSLRSSGWRATDWIIEPKMIPMPTPAPAAPSPTPSARPIALPAFVTLPDVAARMVSISVSSLVLRLDRRADVDGGQSGEDERLDPDDDDHLEEVEDGRRDDHEHQGQRLEDEDQAEEREDEDVASEHVREEPDAQRDQPHELAEDLERDDQDQKSLRRLGDPALEVAARAVPLDPLVVREEEGQQGQRERDGERRGRRVDPPGRYAVPRLPRQRERDEAEEVDDEDEQQQRGHVREPAAHRLRRQPLLRDLRLRHLVQRLADRLPPIGQQGEPAAHREDPESDRAQRPEHQVDDGLRDRQVQRPEVDGDPVVLLELGRRVEVPARERRLRDHERQRGEEEKDPETRQTEGVPK